MASRDDLKGGEKKIEQFLTYLAIDKNVAPSTQNQAMNALVFLYKKVLKEPLDEEINAIRSKEKKNVPEVMTREEVRQMIGIMEGTPHPRRVVARRNRYTDSSSAQVIRQ